MLREFYFSYSTVELLERMPQAEVVGFRVHWEVFTSCAKQKLVFSTDRAAAAAAAKLPAS